MSNSNSPLLVSPINSAVDRPYIMVSGYYGFDNLGDEAILEQLIAELLPVCKIENIIVLSNAPSKTEVTHQVKSINRWDWGSFIIALKKTKVFISGGGGLFQDRTGPRSVLFYAAQIFLAKLMGARVFIYAQGLGPLRTNLGRQITKFALAQAQGITVRDSNSRDIVKLWGLQAELTSDPVWLMKASNLPGSAQSILDSLKGNNSGKVLGISLRNDPSLSNYHLNILSESIAKKFELSTSVLLLPFQLNQDLEPLQKIDIQLQKHGFKTGFMDPGLLSKPSHWLGLIQGLDMLVGMRMHAILMALQCSRPVIGIAYDPKVSFLLNEFKQPLLPLNLHDEKETRKNWSRIIDEAKLDRLDSFACAKLEAIRKLANQNSRYLIKVINN